MTGEFYGLFALSGRATAWMAPLAIGIITAATQSTRLGVACVLFFLVLGFCLLWRVREERRPLTIEGTADRHQLGHANFRLPVSRTIAHGRRRCAQLQSPVAVAVGLLAVLATQD